MAKMRDSVSSGAEPTMTSGRQGPSETPLLTPQIKLIILLLITGYVAFFLSGFGTFLDRLQPYKWRAFPLYIFCAILLLVLQGQIISGANQARIAQRKQAILLARRIFIIIASLVPLLYAGWARFFGGPDNPLVFPLTYLILNGIALAGFGYEIIHFHPLEDQDGVFGGDTSKRALAQPAIAQESAEIDLGPLVLRVLEWASEAASLAGFCILAGIVLTVLSDGIMLPLQLTLPPYVTVDVSWLHAFNLKRLQDLDLALGLLALAAALFLFVVAAVLIASKVETLTFFQALLEAVRRSIWRALRSFFSAVSPLIWMIPAFLIAMFAQQVTTFFRESAATPLPHGVLDLFSPFNPTNLSHVQSGASALGLAGVSIICVLGASLFAEYDPTMISEINQHIADVGRVLVALLPAFLLSLMALNGVLYMTFGTSVPFQLLILTLITMLVAAVYVAITFWARSHNQTMG